MMRLVLYLAWLHVQGIAKAIWQDRHRRFLFIAWLVALAFVNWRILSGHLSLNDVIIDILVGFIVSLPFLR